MTVFVDPKAVLFLLGTEMDFKTDKLSSQFVFNNPNQTSACGCGEFVAITPGHPSRCAPSGRTGRQADAAGDVGRRICASSTVRLRPSRLAANMH